MESHPASEPLVKIAGLAKSYLSGGKELVIFRGMSLAVANSEQVAVIGESGVGKSTLLHLISGLDRPSAGSICFDGEDVSKLPEAALSVFRNRTIGYVWQQHHLLPEFTAHENIMIPLLIGGMRRRDAESVAVERLEEVGLGARRTHRAGELSGGEQQRVAIARALVSRPKLLLADEPTGNLDEKTGQTVFDLLESLRLRHKLTTVLVTHNLAFARRCDRVLKLEAGTLHQV